MLLRGFQTSCSPICSPAACVWLDSWGLFASCRDQLWGISPHVSLILDRVHTHCLSLSNRHFLYSPHSRLSPLRLPCNHLGASKLVHGTDIWWVKLELGPRLTQGQGTCVAFANNCIYVWCIDDMTSRETDIWWVKSELGPGLPMGRALVSHLRTMAFMSGALICRNNIEIMCACFHIHSIILLA